MRGGFHRLGVSSALVANQCYSRAGFELCCIRTSGTFWDSRIPLQPLRHGPLSLEGSKLRRPLTWRIRELGLHKDLLHPRHALVELLVYDVELLEQDAVADHVERLELAALDHLEQMLPILLDGRLAVALEHDAAFHEGADVEMVCLEGEKGGEISAGEL